MAFSKYFEHQKVESEIYREWEKSGAFQPGKDASRTPFTISMPPPNATGTLHLGHAIGMTVEDLMIRWKRMDGCAALWVPGTDHAAIATESVVIRQLQEEGMRDPRHELGREELVARIVNWDPHLQTTVSDDEIYYSDRQAKFYTLRYGPFLVGTSRPETKLGDTAIAVNPQDERYQEHIGRTYEVPWPKGPTITVKVVADEHVDPEFGTGALGVTPAHSHADFEIAQKHNLPLIQVIGEDGRMTEAAGPYSGMQVEAAREAFVAHLKDAGLLEKVESYVQPISLCYRSKKPIEPLPKNQWFIDVNKPAVQWEGRHMTLKQVMYEVVDTGKIKLLPAHEVKTYNHWIENLRDWCISRQIWWGHRVPVWYRGNAVSEENIEAAEEMYVGHRHPEGDGWVQDPDTLDTWFSSALWTFSTLLDSDEALNDSLDLDEIVRRSPDFARFHPTSVMETGYDILFFWVARMILMTTYTVKDIPFHTVYLHGLVLDKDGEKMSKSKPETSIDPLEVIEEYGADALRLSLVLGNSAGSDLKLGKERIVACKRLLNKIWNASKLVQMSTGDKERVDLTPESVTHPLNRWMLTRRNLLLERIDRRMEAFALGDAAEQIRGAFWGEFCDFYLEAIKVDEVAQSPETASVLSSLLDDFLKLFHPFLPFITEQVWRNLDRPGLLISAAWPQPDERLSWTEEAEGVDAVSRAVAAVRSMRAEQNIDPGSYVNVRLQPRGHAEVFERCRPIMERLMRTEELVISETEEETQGAMAVDEAFRAALTLSAADLQAERERLEKQLEGAQKRLASLESRLKNKGFLDNAPAETVESTRQSAHSTRSTITDITDRLEALG